MKKAISFFACLVLLFIYPIQVFSYSLTYTVEDKIIEIAQSKQGYYGDGSNEFNLWYYGKDTTAAWCAVFVSWCADRAGAMGTAVPKRATCSSMKFWFENRNEYYTAESGYIPQKGDIVFMNTSPEDSDGINHVELVTQDGYIVIDGENHVGCIGGNTSDKDYNGSGYVSEKIRPLSGEKAEIIGFAHPSYEKSSGFAAEIYNFTDDIKSNTIKYIESKILRLLVIFENWYTEIFNTKLTDILIIY